ncbi:MAG TPA: hypothetical protein VIS72_13465 [Anaerolineales bacterium]
MDDKLLDVEKRVKRYWYSDGIVELSLGGMFFLLGVYFGLQGYLGENSQASVIMQIGLFVIVFAGIVGVGWLVNTLKARITYPRTGYVEYRKDGQDIKKLKHIIMGVALAVAASSIVLFDFFRNLDSMTLATGVMVGAVFIALRGNSTGTTRFYVVGIFSILLGVVLSLDKLPQEYNLALFYGLLGVVIMVSGGIVLLGYLRENPMLAEDDNE